MFDMMMFDFLLWDVSPNIEESDVFFAQALGTQISEFPP